MKFRAILNDEYDLDEKEPFVLKPWMRTAVFFGILMIILNLCAVLYVVCGKNIYIGDDATYWSYAKNIADGALSPGFFGKVYQSINEAFDNYAAAVPSALFAFLFGGSRLVYVLSLVNLYVVPYLALVYALAKKIGKAAKITTVLVMLLMPIVPFAAFAGFADIGGIVICMLCYNLYYTKNDENLKIWRYVLIGALLVFVMIWRSWYAFFAVSFITAMIADSILFKRKWYFTVSAAATAAVIIVLFFNGFIRDIVIAGYGTAHMEYMPSAGADLYLLARYFGVILLAASAVCSIMAGVYKKEKRTAFLWIQIVVSLIMFISVKELNRENLLIFVPSLAVTLILIIRYISKEWMLVAIGALAVFQTVSVCIPRAEPNETGIKFYPPIANFSILPEKRDDAEQILALKKTLDGITGEGETLGVIADSEIISGDVLRSAETSLGASRSRTDYICDIPRTAADIGPLYWYNYALVAVPAQTRAGADPLITVEAVNSFVNWTDFAAAYDEMYDYATVIDGIEIKLFRRAREVDDQARVDFASRLYYR